MKHLYIFIIIVLNTYLFQAQNVNIPDLAFKDYLVNSICADLNDDGYVESNVDTNNDGEIQVSEAEAVFLLELNQDCLATSLVGLDAFTNLNEFKCVNALVSEIDLSFLTQVDEIEILENINLASINLGTTTSIYSRLTINGNPNLETLNLSNVNSIGTFDFSSNSASISSQMNLELINIQTIGSLSISDNNTLLPMHINFQSLNNVIQSTDIRNNNIATIDLSNLIQTRGFEFVNNATVTELNLDNLVVNDGDGLTQGEIIINGIDLSTVSLSSLETSGSRVIIQGNSVDTVVDLTSLISVNGDLNFYCNCPIVSLPNLQSVNRVIIGGDIQQVDLNALETGGVSLGSINNDLSSINLSNLIESSIIITNNQISEINLPSLVTVEYLWLDNNQLTNINIPSLETAESIRLTNNQFDSFELSNVSVDNLILDENPLTTLELANANIQGLSFNNTDLFSLDLSTVVFEQMYINNSENLLDINIKNGDLNDNITLLGSPNLRYICADINEIDYINGFGLTDCQVNTYCSFVPGGEFFKVEGLNKFDANTNGCDSGDSPFPNAYFSITDTDGITVGGIISDSSGNYSIAIQEGSYNVTPILLYQDYYSINPETIVVNFPSDGSIYNQDFCISPIPGKNDLQIYLIPISGARPGFDSTYELVFRNVGTTTLSGYVELRFNDDVMDFVSSSPTITSQVTDVISWDYSNIEPFESRSIFVTMNLNPPTHPTFPLNDGDVIGFDSFVYPIIGDESIADNSMDLKQNVVNSFDPNDITCLEGQEIIEDEVGKFVHYKIRFENTGSASAVNIVVKDVIDETKFDLSSLTPLQGSHNYVTRITNNNEVEFIFENIQLPFDDANNDGYLVFKIRTLPSLIIGDTFENAADIYFDFNFPIITNTYSTEIVEEILSTEAYINEFGTIYPNPVKDILTIKDVNQISKISIYTLSGQLLIEQKGNTNTIDISEFKDGIYILTISTDLGEINKKIIKSY